MHSATASRATDEDGFNKTLLRILGSGTVSMAGTLRVLDNDNSDA